MKQNDTELNIMSEETKATETESESCVAGELKRGDIVRVKKEWLDPGEDATTEYVVLEQAGINRICVQALGTGLPLAPTYVYDVAWVYRVGAVPCE